MATLTGEEAIRIAREIERGNSDFLRTGIPYTGPANRLVVALLGEIDRLTAALEQQAATTGEGS